MYVIHTRGYHEVSSNKFLEFRLTNQTLRWNHCIIPFDSNQMEERTKPTNYIRMEPWYSILLGSSTKHTLKTRESG